MDHAADGHEPVVREEEAIQHPLGVYFKIWILLFVLSAMSYAVDYYQVQGYLRWFSDSDVYGPQSGAHYCGVYAYGVGAVGIGLFHIGAARIAAHLRRNWFIGSRLDVFSAWRALFERVNHCRTGITTSLE